MKVIALDTNIFIYHFSNHPSFGDKTDSIFRDLDNKKYLAITSIVTLTELLSFQAGDNELEKLKLSFLQSPGLNVIDVTQVIAIEAANIMRKYKSYRISDAIQLATAIYLKAEVFVTNDKRLQSCKEIKIKLL